MSHYYTPDGTPAHFQPKKDGDGSRPTTIADARKLGLVPSVTTILKCLDKPALNAWMVRQGIYAVTTSPDVPGEALDAKIERVLSEGQDTEEVGIAADKGTAIHEAINLSLRGQPYNLDLMPYVMVAEPLIRALGTPRKVEEVVVGDGYAGKMDCLLEGNDVLTALDIKTCKTVPKKESWPEHKLQTAAYAAALGNTNGTRIQTGNLYISTTTIGEVKLFIQEDWTDTARAFSHLVQYWRIVNKLHDL